VVTTDSATTQPHLPITEQVLDWLAAHPHTGTKPDIPDEELTIEKKMFRGYRFLDPIPSSICMSADSLDYLAYAYLVCFHAGELIMVAVWDEETTMLRWRPVCIDDYCGGIILARITDEADDAAGRAAATSTARPPLPPGGDMPRQILQ
jgi:hypothetical protein